MANARKKPKLKEPVKVRTKKLADGSESYYLDIYVDGKRTYEFLKLYHLPELNARIKEQNRATREAVEAIKSKRIIELTNSKAGLKKTSIRSKTLLADWMQTYLEMQERKQVRGLKMFKSTIRIVSEFTKGKKVRMADMFIDWIQHDYISRLGKSLEPTSCADYLKYFSASLNAAVRAEVIPENPFMALQPQDRVKVPASKRAYLTIDEVKALISTEAPRQDVKQAYLFSCYCGLRLGDIYRLRWKDISKDGEQWRVAIVMHKTSRPNFLPLSQQAVKWLPERGEAQDEDRVFATLPAEQNVNINLDKWAKSAGIGKKVTFHTSRHTCATMLLTLGADLYTVSKILGHSSIKTTQVYAKIIDPKKVAAVNLVDKVFD